MLQNSLDTENRCKRSNWAGSIKECLESYGFQDVWAQGGVFENPSIDANRKGAMFAFYALKHREEMLAS